MSVKYRKVKNNRKGSATRGKIYGKAVVDGVIRTKEIAEKIGKRCTLTEPDIIAVINALETEIAYALADGKRVILDGFGSFKVGISTSPADTPKKFTTANIKGFHVVFAPAIEMYMNKRIKSMLRGVKVEEMTEYNGLDSGSDGTSGGTSGSGSDGAVTLEEAPPVTTRTPEARVTTRAPEALATTRAPIALATTSTLYSSRTKL